MKPVEIFVTRPDPIRPATCLFDRQQQYTLKLCVLCSQMSINSTYINNDGELLLVYKSFASEILGLCPETEFCLIFRLNRMHDMQTIVTDDRGVCLSVCPSVTRLISFTLCKNG